MAAGREPDEPLEPGAATTPVTPETSAAAVALALARRRGGAKADAVDEFLRKQSRMLDLQMEHLHEQRALQVRHLEQQEKHLRLRYFGDRLRIGLQLLGILVGVGVVVALGAMLWQAHEDHGVSIQAFSVPPDLAQRGLTGQVVASQLLDRLAALQTRTVTARPASSYANDWGEDIKVEIPETGVSIGELDRYLRQWLGSETQITGEVVRTPSGLAMTARAGAAPGATAQGAEADLDKLVGQTAEAIYRQTQPYRYAVYLASTGRNAEAVAAFSRIAQTGDTEDQAWAYTGWAAILQSDGQYREAARLYSAALKLNPRLGPAYPALGIDLNALDNREDILPSTRREIPLLESGQMIGIPRTEVAGRLRLARAAMASNLGDYQGDAAQLASGAITFDLEGRAIPYGHRDGLAAALAQDHDVAASKRTGSTETRFLREAALDDWGAAAALATPFAGSDSVLGRRSPFALSYIATAYAHVGRLAEAQALIEPTPLDCDACVRTHGLIAELQHDRPAADRWYAEAEKRQPSLPFADTDWGQALLARGDADGAIAKLQEAHRRGPNFADPLELWGEALMAKRDYAGAVTKFAEADRHAPHWGRNHLRWGEALMLSGRYAEARRQYEAANTMDLSKPDRAALDVLLARTAKGPLHG
jgi:tetratricopeptide (TPR) repeat protein